MSKHSLGLLSEIASGIPSDPVYTDLITALRAGRSSAGIHLAIFREPFLGFLLQGRKTVESRFSENLVAPYHRVRVGDFLFLKRAAGPVIGVCRVSQAWFYEIDPLSLDEIRTRFADSMCATAADFWRSRERSRYATLLAISDLHPLPALSIHKRDRRGWIVLRSPFDSAFV